jgi:hypothetical protein
MKDLQAYLSSLNSGGAQSANLRPGQAGGRPNPSATARPTPSVKPESGGQRPRPIPPKKNPWIPPRERPIDRPAQRPPIAAQPAPASATAKQQAIGNMISKLPQWSMLGIGRGDAQKLLGMYKKNLSSTPPIAAQPTPAPTAPPTEWWKRNPSDITELLRQLSVNAGQMGMPGGNVGAVQKPAFGTMGQPVIPQDMRTYGQAPNMGEATFFQQSMNGGMAPIAAMSPLGVPAGWNPLGR